MALISNKFKNLQLLKDKNFGWKKKIIPSNMNKEAYKRNIYTVHNYYGEYRGCKLFIICLLEKSST